MFRILEDDHYDVIVIITIIFVPQNMWVFFHSLLKYIDCLICLASLGFEVILHK